ncbi:hypothetical protein M407DRAFT_6548 [Tulasnella calospora MUT 4182]|uniref:Uncharacterized protein n=1 Tax=Tulasnella calospora MUT 4182 TaxID=1051891 RepID=A0A0C3M5L4_9AGAM|nr:hypothetical protein M407DRAFT_6548 [Tulasnella calospora MUT 4182]
MTEAYGLPLFLAASSADLTSATFSDIYGRYSLWSSTFVTPTSPTTHRYFVGIGSGSNGSSGARSQPPSAYGRDALKPSILLDVEAPKDDKWTIAGGGKTVPVTKYLRNVEDPEATKSSKYRGRAFVASDGQHYEWRYRDADEKDPGWTCTTPQGYVVAHFVEHSSSGGALPSTPYYPPGSSSSASPSSSTSPTSTPTRVKRSSFDFLTRRRRSSSASSFGVVANPDTPGGMLVVNESWTHIAEGESASVAEPWAFLSGLR